MANLKYVFGAAPLQNPIAGNAFLTGAWQQWFIYLQQHYLVRWEDLSFPASSIFAGPEVEGAGSPPARDATTGALKFSGIQDETLGGIAEMRHRWLPASIVRPHMHLLFPDGVGNTRWLFEYDVANIGEDFAGSYTAATTITVANPGNALRHVYASLGDIDMTGYEESCVILWKLSRLATSDAADDFEDVVHLLCLDFAYQVQKAGTVPDLV